MVSEQSPRWTFLTNHGQALACIAEDPSVRLRDISERLGITERAAHRIVGELSEGGYITRRRVGRRNTYVVHSDQPLPDAVARKRSVGDLLTILASTGPS
jgi:DNA-binding MarR family transcriptional regulator